VLLSEENQWLVLEQQISPASLATDSREVSKTVPSSVRPVYST
jgi:hypothetical protein